MPSSFLTLLFAVFIIASLLTKLWLDTRQARHVARHRDTVPAAFAPHVPALSHQRAANYTLDKLRFGLLSTAVSTIVLIGWTLLGGLDALNVVVRDAVLPAWGALPYQLVLLGAFTLIGTLIELPLEAWHTFRLEQKHGFNRMTWGMWLGDQAKQLLLGLLLGGPIAALILWLMGAAGAQWWLWAWGAWVAFSLLLMVIFPIFIAPLFNKFEPLKDQGLIDRVNALMARCGFTAKGFFVMDGSRRSAHANAYFTGLGAAKRVVFYDTLLSKLTHGEVEAVLAHELGHFKHKHVMKRMVMMFALSLLAFNGAGFGLLFLILMAPLVLLIPFGPLSRWQKEDLGAVGRWLLPWLAMGPALVSTAMSSSSAVVPAGRSPATGSPSSVASVRPARTCLRWSTTCSTSRRLRRVDCRSSEAPTTPARRWPRSRPTAPSSSRVMRSGV